MIKSLNTLGLYGGASLNSVELALIRSDGIDVQEYAKSCTIPYPDSLKTDIRTVIAQRNWTFDDLENSPHIQELREKVSCFYADAVCEFSMNEPVDIVGIDGLTIFSDPAHQCSYQIEDGHKVCDLLSRDIITHFHKADLLIGGQASPLTPAFFGALGQSLEKPLLFIDLEAVSSLIYISETGELLAFDCAPGLAMIEDWTFRHANMQTDYNGRLAIIGKVHKQIVNSLLGHKFLHKVPPKSLDILCFSDKKEHLEGLSLEDGAATATNFIAEAVYQAALDYLPAIPQNIYIAGEGCKNPSLVRFIKQNFAPRQVHFIGEINASLTAVGAQTTAFNAVRRFYGLPITFPRTTGVFEPITGGEIYEKK